MANLEEDKQGTWGRETTTRQPLGQFRNINISTYNGFTIIKVDIFVDPTVINIIDVFRILLSFFVSLLQIFLLRLYLCSADYKDMYIWILYVIFQNDQSYILHSYYFDNKRDHKTNCEQFP